MNRPVSREVGRYDIRRLQQIVGAPAVRRLRLLARRVANELSKPGDIPSVWHINSSAVGGGVADILSFLVPFSTGLGVSSRWIVIGGDDKFFEVTKSFHNALQGFPGARVDGSMLSYYLKTLAANAELLDRLVEKQDWGPPDVVVLHDPQPAGLASYLRAKYPETIIIWRGHIHFDVGFWDIFHPAQPVWSLLLGFVNQCDAAVFHLPEQVPPGIRVPVRFILPSINPLAYVNRDLTSPAASRFVDATLKKYGLESLCDRSTPVIIQNARFDPWKDHEGVIRAFRAARSRMSKGHDQPHLVCIGPMADDDPEAKAVLGQLANVLNGDGTVHILAMFPKQNRITSEQALALSEVGIDSERLLPPDLMELEINAFQTRADIIVAKSIREGFGLSVAGAGYHGKARIVSEIGGLSVQVRDEFGNLYACPVGGRDFNREASVTMTADWLVKLLSSRPLRSLLGARAREHVIRNFLPHRHLEDYFRLFLELRSVKRATMAAGYRPYGEDGLRPSEATI